MISAIVCAIGTPPKNDKYIQMHWVNTSVFIFLENIHLYLCNGLCSAVGRLQCSPPSRKPVAPLRLPLCCCSQNHVLPMHSHHLYLNLYLFPYESVFLFVCIAVFVSVFVCCSQNHVLPMHSHHLVASHLYDLYLFPYKAIFLSVCISVFVSGFESVFVCWSKNHLFMVIPMHSHHLICWHRVCHNYRWIMCIWSPICDAAFTKEHCLHFWQCARVCKGVIFSFHFVFDTNTGQSKPTAP